MTSEPLAPADPAAPWRTPRAAYLHIPFCAHHCGYCDFAVTAGQDHLQELYLDALELELRGLQRPQPVETLFLGGGTPTYLSASQLRRLMRLLGEWFPRTPGGEFTIESTPDSLSDEKLRALCEGGLTRLSIGVQTFQARLLPTLDRIHSPDQVEGALRLARRFPLQVSLDLIFGIPGQTPADWRADLERIVALKIEHISTYGLTYEKGTPLWKQWQRGQLQQVPEEVEASMYVDAMQLLESAGYEQYEISNFARPGCRCRHNEVYWANHAYHGVGVGAARYVDFSRELNVRNTQDYIRRLLAGESPTFQREVLTPRERARETVGVQLRRTAGIELAQFREQTGYDLLPLLGEGWQYLLREGLLAQSAMHLHLTRQGRLVGDAVIAQLLRDSSD